MSTQDGVYVIGGGGHSKVVLATLHEAGFPVAGVVDDNPGLAGKTILGYPVLGPVTRLATLRNATAVLAVGDNRTRCRLADSLSHLKWATVVHPRAYVHPSVCMGAGSVVFAGAVIQPGVVIGTHCIVNTSATVDHDCRLGDFVHLAPGVHVAGSVAMDNGALLGMGACIIQGMTIGSWSIIGAGAAVIHPVPAGVTAIGVPARIRRASHA